MTAVVPSPKSRPVRVQLRAKGRPSPEVFVAQQQKPVRWETRRVLVEASPLRNASRTKETRRVQYRSQRYCSAVTVLKEQSFERVFRTWRNCYRDSPGSCLRVANRWRANTLFLVMTYTRFNSATAASYVSSFVYSFRIRRILVSTLLPQLHTFLSF